MTDPMPGWTDWIDGALSALDRSRSGEVEIFRDMPWATVAHFPTDEGRMWFKSNHPTFAYEAALLVELNTIAPGAVLEPIAIHAVTGWFLADDAGRTSDGGGGGGGGGSGGGGSSGGSGGGGGLGAEIAALYSALQVASAPAVPDLLAVGVPDRRPAILPPIFDNALTHAERDLAKRCRALRSRFLQACDALETDGRLSIVNGDLKMSHAFVGPPIRLFDWADAVVTHPLASVATASRGLDAVAGGPNPAAVVADAWSEDLDSELVASATAVAALLGADVWMRDPPVREKCSPMRYREP